MMHAFLLIFLSTTVLADQPQELKIRALNKEDKKVFASLQQTFKRGTMEADVKKNMHLATLDVDKRSHGRFQLQTSQLRMELQGDENTQLIINQKKLYLVSLPRPDRPEMKTNVIETSVNASQVKKQGLMVLLAGAGFESLFLVSGVIDTSTNQRTFFLSPKPDTKGLRRAQVKVEGSKQPKLMSIVYWDELDNKTEYVFSDHKKVTSIPQERFEYQPPADAEIIRE